MLDRLLARRRYVPSLGRVQPFLLLAAALGLASYGQHAIGRNLPGWVPLPDRLNEELTRIYHRPQSVAFVFFLFLAAALLFLLAGREQREPAAREQERSPATRLSALARGRIGRLALALSVLGCGLWAYLIWQLAREEYEEWYPLLFVVALLAVAAVFLAWDLRRGVGFRPRVHWWEVALLVGLVGAFVGLNVRDLDGWRYSFIGDEGAFFDTAKLIGEGTTLNLFSQVGTYGDQPLASSAYQSMVMKVFGFDYFGWKLATLLLIAATIPPFYFLVRTLFGLRSALFGTALLSASHYLFAYAHTGYHNVFPILPAVLAFALFFGGLRSSSSLLLLGSGIVSGFGFYTFFPSRAVIVILALFVFTLGFRRWRPSLVLPVSLGFILAVVPIFAVDKGEVIDAMFGRSLEQVSEPVAQHILENVPRSLFAFNFSPDQGHYVSGALMDAASATLAVLGLSYAAYRVGSAPYRFLMVWFVVALVVSGLFSPHERVPFTRLHMVLPAMAAFAGLGVHRILLIVEETMARARLRPFPAALTFAVLVPLVFALNVQRFWDDSAKHSPTTPQTVAVRAVLEGPCEAGPDTTVLSADSSPWLTGIFRTYDLGDQTPKVVTYDEVSAPELADTACAVLIQIDRPEAVALIEALERDYPGRRMEELTDLSGSQRALVFR